jgi:hypothetical protein
MKHLSLCHRALVLACLWIVELGLPLLALGLPLLALGQKPAAPVPHALKVQGALSDAAFPLLHARVTASRTDFFVYEDGDAGSNHAFASGFFASSSTTLTKIELDAFCIDDPLSSTGCSSDATALDTARATVLRISFDPLTSGEFVGINFEEPENWGVEQTGRGYDLTGATSLAFEARSPTPGGIRVQFGVGGNTTAFILVPNSWTPFSFLLSDLGLSASELTDVHILFTVVTNVVNAPAGGTVLIDNVRFEPVPPSVNAEPSFPLSTETFGVVPVQEEASGRVPIPPDQILRNVTTTYESALVIPALLARGMPDDVADVIWMADALLYALAPEHDANGIVLPRASDGATGLRNAYEGGALSLFNDQAAGLGGRLTGEVRLSGFSAELCGPSRFCLVLDGATGGNNAFALLALLGAYRHTNDARYLDGARTIARWTHAQLLDSSGTGFGGYYLGYPDEGAPKDLITGKSVENNADIFSAFTNLAAIEDSLGNPTDAALWTERANLAGDFVMEMFDDSTGCFHAGTVPVGTPSGYGITPTGEQRGDEVINVFPFLDANTFTTLAMAPAPRYRDQIDWRAPVQCMLDHFKVDNLNAVSQVFSGFNLIQQADVVGPEGIAWEFTGQAVVTMRLVDALYEESNFEDEAVFYLAQLQQAQQVAPFTDGQGLVASTLEGGDLLPPLEHCLTTPFQCIPERVGLAATTWAMFADLNRNPLAIPSEPLMTLTEPNGGETICKPSQYTIRWDDNIADNVSIEVIAGTQARTLASTTESDGSFTWRVTNRFPNRDDYKIRITSVNDASVTDESDGTFTVGPCPSAEKEGPGAFVLEANHPNPFNPATTIRYALPQAEAVRLVVYNMLGQEVARLVEGLVAAGRHEVVFDGQGLPSGVYLYRLEAGTFVQTRRMTLVK